MKWTEKEDELLINIAKDFNVVELHKNFFNYRTLSSIRERIKKYNLKYQNVDINFFKLDNEISNYILGYWLADGCIMKKKSGGSYFSIVSKDIEQLEKIKAFMQIKTKLYKNSGAYEIRVANKELISSLEYLGATERKTHSIEINDIKYNPNYFYDFLRGYFDGDGCITIQNKRYFAGAKFTGSKTIIQSLHNILIKEYNCRVYKDDRIDKDNCYYLELNGKNAKSLLRNMYNNSPKIFLERKYQRYLKFVTK